MTMNPRLLVLLLFVLFASGQTSSITAESQTTFLYFAYGSNMLSSRIHKNNPSAEIVTIAKLKNHRLDFITYSHWWHGCASTIVPSEGAETWGVVWRMNASDLERLDVQELVPEGEYFAKNVTVRTADGEDLACRTYQQTVLPEVYVPLSKLPSERQPSPAYLNKIIEGGKEHDLPAYYLKFLQSIRDNGYQGEALGN